jgi:DNA modification methylase
MHEVPAVVVRGLSDAEKAALRIADNKLALNAGWDTDLLRIELGNLRDIGFDLDLTGFGEIELGDIFADRTAGLTDPDDVPVVTEATTQPGDVWTLGRHRLVCGDATSEVDVSLCLAGVRPHLMVTDPPYGVDYDAAWRDRELGGKPGGRATGIVHNDVTADWSDAWLLFPGDVAYVWSAPGPLHCVTHDSLKAAGIEPRTMIVWAKSQFVIGRGNYHAQHEPCWYAVRGTAHWQGDRKQSTLWQIDKPMKSETGHSAQKPVECMRRPIENNSSPGQAVYDPFVGSGTTIIAAEMTGRSAHCLEISPAYCDTAVERWQRFTGQQATRN